MILIIENWNKVAALNPRLPFLQPFFVTFDTFRDNRKVQTVEQRHLKGKPNCGFKTEKKCLHSKKMQKEKCDRVPK